MEQSRVDQQFIAEGCVKVRLRVVAGFGQANAASGQRPPLIRDDDDLYDLPELGFGWIVIGAISWAYNNDRDSEESFSGSVLCGCRLFKLLTTTTFLPRFTDGSEV